MAAASPSSPSCSCLHRPHTQGAKWFLHFLLHWCLSLVQAEARPVWITMAPWREATTIQKSFSFFLSQSCYRMYVLTRRTSAVLQNAEPSPWDRDRKCTPGSWFRCPCSRYVAGQALLGNILAGVLWPSARPERPQHREAVCLRPRRPFHVCLCGHSQPLVPCES